MEIAISAAKPRLSALVAAAQRGERVVITKRGEPAAELVTCAKSSGFAEGKPEGDFFVRLDAARKRLGIKAMPPEEASTGTRRPAWNSPSAPPSHASQS